MPVHCMWPIKSMHTQNEFLSVAGCTSLYSIEDFFQLFNMLKRVVRLVFQDV